MTKSITQIIRALELTKRVADEDEVEPLLESILDSALELTSGERGYVVLRGEDGRLEVTCGRNYGKAALPPAEVRVSGTVVRRVLTAGRPELVHDAGVDPRYASSKSAKELGLRSVIVAPLAVRGERLGAVLVETRSRAGAFEDEHLRVVELIAANAALALELRKRSARLARRLERSESARMRAERAAFERRKGRELVSRFPRLLGASPRFRALLIEVEQACEGEGTVLLEGESGTGKELVARTIHEHGRARRGPFVAVNSPEIAGPLAEAALFGHLAGAFTGADRDRDGLVRAARGGTLFLDEIGDLPLDCQAKLLRFLQEGTIRPLGATREEKAPVRVVAATNRNLRQMVASRGFREDLYYRLRVHAIELPPLRARREDVVALAEHFLEAAARAENKARPVLSAEAIEKLEGHEWPGNVRELENAMRRAVALSGETVRARDLRLERARGGEGKGTLRETEREMIVKALRDAGEVKRAAELLGIHRVTLHRKMRRMGIEAP